MSTKYIVDNVSEQTITGDLIINGNFEITGTTNTRPYKVYTALVTQSGGDNYNDSDNFPLEIGVTYTIIEYGSYTLGDFTNVGAPNNEIGTSFIATNTTPNSWGTNIGLSWNGGAPVATVLENTIGNIWFTFQSTGQYYANSNVLFTTNKTVVFGGSYNADLILSIYFGADNSMSEGEIRITTVDGLSLSNSVLSNTPIEIRVYN